MLNQALILAAGRGLRLDRPGTPKPIVDVDGLPMIVRLVLQLEKAGIKRIAVVTGYDSKKVSNVLARHTRINTDICIIKNQNWKMGLASSILAAQGKVEDKFVLAMADHVFDNSLIELMMSSYVSDQSPISALVDTRIERIHSIESAVKVALDGYRIIEIDRDLKSFEGVDAGLFIMSSEIFTFLDKAYKQNNHADLTDALKILAIEAEVNAIFAKDGDWDDVDTPADLIHAEMRLRKQRRIEKIRKIRMPVSPVKNIEYQYKVEMPHEAQILVGRGFVSAPGNLELIPDESASSPIFIITDETVNGLYGNTFTKKMKEQGYDAHCIVLQDGESSKTIANFSYLAERIFSFGVDERSVLISLGGGVVCNVCGFLASTLYRGLSLVHVPTTLMAQCDAAISHKQAVNGSHGKNMIGSYYMPRIIAVDINVLSTLSARLKKDGFAEIIKHALGQDPEYVKMLLDHSGDFNDMDFLEKVVRRNIELKCKLSISDPKELSEGMVLQYGHTVGHAVEHLSGYNLYHGEAVAIGMVAAARVSRILGACDDNLVDLHKQVCLHYGLPIEIPNSIKVDNIVESLRYNKRYLAEGTRMALLAETGQLLNVDGDYAIPVSDQVLIEAIKQSKEKK